MKKIQQKSPSNGRVRGVALAVAAAGLLGGCGSNGNGNDVDSFASAQADLVQCHGVNKCGGHNDCKTDSNACGGHASCKGTGFVKMSAKACGDIGGTEKDGAGSIATADLIQCHGVNICGGHNDCKTADNACGGHASCKGTGFVKMPAKACDDVGGKTG